MPGRRRSYPPTFFDTLSQLVGDDSVVAWATVRRSAASNSLIGVLSSLIGRGIGVLARRRLAARLSSMPESALLVLSDGHLVFYRLHAELRHAGLRLGAEVARFALDDLAAVKVRGAWWSRGLSRLQLRFRDGSSATLNFGEQGVHSTHSLAVSFAEVGVPTI